VNARRRPIDDAVLARRRADLVTGLRGLTRRDGARGAAPVAVAGPPMTAGAGATTTSGAGPATAGEERCDLCATTVPEDHRHLLNLVERKIECVCESCWALRSGDPEFRPTGTRTLWLPELRVPDDVWAGFQIPIGLAFFMESTTAGCIVALYPSPAGATESELHFSSWQHLVALNPMLGGLEADVEGLIVNRMADPHAYAIAPIDRCYELTGTVKMAWEGISGGTSVTDAVAGFFSGLKAQALAA
jgi:hypothetical protein